MKCRNLVYNAEVKNSGKITSPAGNRTPVSRVTGGDTHHYTTEDFGIRTCENSVIKANVLIISAINVVCCVGQC